MLLISLPLALDPKFLAIAAALHAETLGPTFQRANGAGNEAGSQKKPSLLVLCVYVCVSLHLLFSTMCSDTVFVLFHRQLPFEPQVTGKQGSSAAVYDTYLSCQ